MKFSLKKFFCFPLCVFFFFCNSSLFGKPVFPFFSDSVVDQASILSASTKEEIRSLLSSVDRDTAQVVVVTVSSLQGLTIEDYGYQLGRHWGVGSKEKDNGVIFLIAPMDRKMRIEVGYGLEGVLTDALASQIIQDSILPEFRKNDFDRGALEGTKDILKALGGELKRRVPTKGKGELLALIILILFFLLILFLRWLDPGIFSGSSHGYSSGSGWGGGGSSSSSSGGGGGGSFGGGGSSGSW